ncbi:MAG: hypothetical protein M3O30_14445 [Planctomycetota bacterium]|nr:hypothetical protein [Planctomycetota bacterium]
MRFQYSDALRQHSHLYSLSQNRELEIREVFNDLVSVQIFYDLADGGLVRAVLSDVGKSSELFLSVVELGDERRCAQKLKDAWTEMFEPPAIEKGAGI